MNPRKIQRYGWTRDLPSPRDPKYLDRVRRLTMMELPSAIDMRAQCPSVYDQGKLGSCTANAIAAAIEFDQMKQGLQYFAPSRLFIYYNERDIEGTVNSDSGAQIRDGIDSIMTQGACSETEWPYDIGQFTTKPSDQCYTDAVNYKGLTRERIGDGDLGGMKTCLASGTPFVFGFVVYSSFESNQVKQTGIVPMPRGGEEELGGHAVFAVGYDDNDSRFIVRNSWGTDWGIAGYFTIPYAYLSNTDLASDFWAIQTVL